MNALSEREIGRLVWLLLGVLIASVLAVGLYTQIGTLLFALFLYYATRPLYRRLDTYLSHPNVTVTLTVLAVVLPLLGVMGYALLQALTELNQLLARHLLTTLLFGPLVDHVSNSCGLLLDTSVLMDSSGK